ncbi:FAD/NAD(P)-binding protein [Leptolyngbya sp. 15MV]|nr:FAD/NAD(P)-binding protein [Leptolyngbya sp. 15MV]
MPGHVGIVGGGFSGTLQAINLLRHDGPRATLIERRLTPGVGLAYGEAAPDHVLNVRAANMSALPDEPDHFVRWLERRGVAGGAGAFVPRLTYGAYLQELLAEAIARQPGRLEIVCGAAVDCDLGEGVRIDLADGRQIGADLAILAVGNLPPHHPRGLSAAMAGDLYAADPWDEGATAGLGDDDTVLILGTGLTMVDVVLKLDAEGFRGRMLALSRRGLLPHRHGAPAAFAPIEDRPAPVASALVRGVRARAGAVGWRNAVDELRRFTTPLWRAADDMTRERFLRHLRPWWDIHRHRIPQASTRLGAEELQASVLLWVDSAPDGRFNARRRLDLHRPHRTSEPP